METIARDDPRGINLIIGSCINNLVESGFRQMVKDYVEKLREKDIDVDTTVVMALGYIDGTICGLACEAMRGVCGRMVNEGERVRIVAATPLVRELFEFFSDEYFI